MRRSLQPKQFIQVPIPMLTNLSLSLKFSVNQPVFALILAVSEENGLEYNQLFTKSVNT